MNLVALTLVVFVVFFVIAMAVGAALYRVVSRRAYRELQWARWDPIPPGPEHDPMRPTLDGLAGEGYAVESFALLHLGRSRPRPSAVLVHPDGGLALVSVSRGFRRYVVPTLSTCLVPGARWLQTCSFPVVAEDPSHLIELTSLSPLIEVTARPPAVPGLVARHRASRAWLAEQGVASVPVPFGGAGREIEAHLRAESQHGPPTFHRLWINGLTGGGPLRARLADRATTRARLDEIRHMQAAGSAVPRGTGPTLPRAPVHDPW